MIEQIVRPPAVLVYHGIGDGGREHDPERLLTPVSRLEAHVRMLRAARYEIATAAELADDPPRAGIVVLTFDDGWQNWLTGALPVLADHGVRATFYVCPGLWGKRHPDVPSEDGRLLVREEALALHEAGMELAAHSLTHPDLRTLDDAALEREVRGSKDAVEELTGRACETFAYPFGLHDARVERAVADAGFRLAFRWLPGPWRRFAAPRLPVPTVGGGLVLALKMRGIRRRWVR